MSISDDDNSLKRNQIVSSENEKEVSLPQKLIAEFLGTAFLVFVVTGIGHFTVSKMKLEKTTPIFVAYNGGFEGALVLTSMIYIFGKISGAHFNPAVSIPMFLREKITLQECIFYIVAQILGAFFGSILVGLCSQGNFENLSSNAFEEHSAWSYFSCFLCEFILTFGLVLAIFASTIERNNFGNLTGLIVGNTLYFLGITGNNVSGASLNPARSIAPAIITLFTGETTPIKQLWLYIVAPILGGISAGYISKLFE